MSLLVRAWRRLRAAIWEMMTVDVYDTAEDRKRQSEQDRDETPRPPHS